MLIFVEEGSLKNALKLKSCSNIGVLRRDYQSPVIYGDCNRHRVTDIETIQLAVVVMTAKWKSNDSGRHCKEGQTHE